ncbi:MAG TPA: hypothetical protein VMV86_02515 [Methanosarcinales archaeon]|nr:hypothetical protein [Methanosarcinales archaeon]
MEKKKVIIVGYAYSKKEVEWDNKESEIWIMNDMYNTVPRFDRLFEIHSDKHIVDYSARKTGRNHLEDLKKIGHKIYMQNRWKDIPMSVKYPLEEITKEFYINEAMGDKLFMTCTVTYMLALAIYEKFEEISLYGIDLSVDGEYKDEMPGAVYWLGLAAGRGIKLKISSHSPLLKCFHMYGYEQEKKQQFNAFLDTEIQRIEEIKQTAIKNQEYYFAEENKCIGAEVMMNHIKKITNI